MLSTTLKNLVESIPGAHGAILMGFDGITVDQYLKTQETDIGTLATELSVHFMDMRKTIDESLGLGQVSDISLRTEQGTVLVRCLSEEFFVVLLLDQAGNSGKGRWKLRMADPEIRAQLL